MAETLAVQLTRVQAAIAAIENGAQSYSVGNFSFNRGSLSELYDREQRLLNLIAHEGNAGRTVAEF